MATQQHSGGSSIPATQSSATAFLQKWENNAPLSEPEIDQLSRLSAILAEQVPPKEFLVSEEQPKAPPSADHIFEALNGMDTIQQFYNWFDNLENELGKEEEEKYISYSNRLKAYRGCCDDLLTEMDESLQQLRDLEKSYLLVETKTSELHNACESILLEQNRLVAFADNIAEKLTYFNELDRIFRYFSMPNINVTDPMFLNTLQRVDECIVFVQKNPSFLDAESYLHKFRQLLNIGLTFLKNYVITTLRSASQQVLHTIEKDSNGSEALDESVYYIKFRAIAPKVKSLIQEIESRSSIREYQILLADCHQNYVRLRRHLLTTTVLNYCTKTLPVGKDIHAMIRSGCNFMIQVCHMESQLYYNFFDAPSSALTSLLAPFSDVLYGVLRQVIIHSHSIDTLCCAVDILRTEILDEALSKSGKDSEAFRPVVSRMLEDAQERLIFLAQKFIRDEILNFTPGPDDLQYPEKLVGAAEQLSQALSKKSQSSSSGDHVSVDEDFDAPNYDAIRAMYKTWYPALERTLLALSKLYLSVEPSIFEGLAQESVAACISALVNASRTLASRKTMLDGHLFLLRHLMILRNQITPFDIDFKIVEKQLDFTNVYEGISKILSGRGAVAAILGVVQSPPRITSRHEDAKRDLEVLLRTATEGLVSMIIKDTLEPVVLLYTRAQAYRTAHPTVQSSASQLAQQAFATTPKVLEAVDQALKLLAGKLPAYLDTLRLYLETEGSLNSVVASLKDHSETMLRQLVDITLTGGYSPEDMQQISVSVQRTSIEMARMFSAAFPIV